MPNKIPTAPVPRVSRPVVDAIAGPVMAEIAKRSVIPLRCKAGATSSVLRIVSDPTCTDFEDTAFLHACPAIRATPSAVRCEPLD